MVGLGAIWNMKLSATLFDHQWILRSWTFGEKFKSRNNACNEFWCIVGWFACSITLLKLLYYRIGITPGVHRTFETTQFAATNRMMANRLIVNWYFLFIFDSGQPKRWNPTRWPLTQRMPLKWNHSLRRKQCRPHRRRIMTRPLLTYRQLSRPTQNGKTKSMKFHSIIGRKCSPANTIIDWKKWHSVWSPQLFCSYSLWPWCVRAVAIH